MIKALSFYQSGMNPVAIKELRQTVKGSSQVIILNIVLVILVLAAMVYRAQSGFSPDRQGGSSLFYSIISLLGFVCSVVLPLIMYFRTGSERNSEDPDLMYLTNMTPIQIILGKYAVTVCTQVFYISLCLPFIAFSYLLKGIDVYSMAQSVGSLFLFSFLMVQAGIYFGSIPMNKSSRLRVSILFVIFFLIFGSNIFSGLLMYGIVSGSGPIFSTANYSLYLLTLAYFSGLFFVLNIAILLPPSSNRPLAPRIFLSATWLIGLFYVFFVNKSFLNTWSGNFYVMGLLSLIIATGSGDSINSRIRRQIPKSPSLKTIAFLFYNTSAGGILWSVLIIVLSLLANIFISYRNFAGPISVAIAVFAYSQVFFLITRTSDSPRFRRMSSILTFIAIAVVSAVFSFLSAIHGELELLVISPLGGLVDDDNAMVSIILFGSVALIAFLINMRTYQATVKDFFSNNRTITSPSLASDGDEQQQ